VLEVEPGLIEGTNDLVMCQNVMTLMPEESCEAAIRYLVQLVKPGGILALGGGPLGLIHRLVAAHGFEAILEDAQNIHEAWTVQRRFYDNLRPPAWALEPFDATHPEGAMRYCTLFRNPIRG
jgi:hypothetical protein